LSKRQAPQPQSMQTTFSFSSSFLVTWEQRGAEKPPRPKNDLLCGVQKRLIYSRPLPPGDIFLCKRTKPRPFRRMTGISGTLYGSMFKKDRADGRGSRAANRG
jgi:hypothetical protein